MNRSRNTKKVAKTYCITDKEVKEILKKAKIKILPVKEKIVSDAEQALNDIGMSQKDFYKS